MESKEYLSGFIAALQFARLLALVLKHSDMVDLLTHEIALSVVVPNKECVGTCSVDPTWDLDAYKMKLNAQANERLYKGTKNFARQALAKQLDDQTKVISSII